MYKAVVQPTATVSPSVSSGAGPSQLPYTSQPLRPVMFNATDVEFYPRPSKAVVVEPEDAADNKQSTQTFRLPVQVQQPRTGQQQQARRRPDTIQMVQSPDHALPAQPTRHTTGEGVRAPELWSPTLEEAERVADLRSDLENPEDTSSTTTIDQAGPTSKPQGTILETDYDDVDLLPLSWAGDREDIKNRSDNAVAKPNRPPYPSTPAITAAVATVVQAATRPKLTPLSLPTTEPDPWVTTQVTMQINHSPLQAGLSTTVADELTRASGRAGPGTRDNP